MVSALRTVNGLAVEILFFLKKLDAKQFADGILGRQFKERGSLRRSPVKDPGQRIFWSGNAENSRGIRCRAIGIVAKDPRGPGFPKDGLRRPGIGREKELRALHDPFKRFMG